MVNPHDVLPLELALPPVTPGPDVVVKMVVVLSTCEVDEDADEVGVTKQRSFQRIKIHSRPSFSSIHLALPRQRDMISSSSASLFEAGSASPACPGASGSADAAEGFRSAESSLFSFSAAAAFRKASHKRLSCWYSLRDFPRKYLTLCISSLKGPSRAQ